MLDPKLVSLLQKVVPISPEKISQFSFMLFGTGGFAKNIYQQFSSNITGVIEHEASIAESQKNCTQSLISPKQAKGNVLIGSDIGNFQYNQLLSLAEADHSRIEKVLLVDPFIQHRNIEQQSPEKTIVLLEHANGVVKHDPLLSQFKRYFARQGKVVASICPLTLYYYSQYFSCQDVIMFSGQRALYDIGRQVFANHKLTYMEYGFFPQSEHFYLDKLGVNQNCSLMTDDLDWVEQKHFEKLKRVKASYLDGFRYIAKDYILVPLQVPDDPNVVNCSRFTNGMQEFIDYIVEFYPARQKIMFKPHPKDPKRRQYDYKGKNFSNLPFLTLLESASKVHGITSSTLYEAALAGVDVITEGKSILAKHLHQKDKLFAAMVDRQISKFDDEFEYVLHKYSNIG
ncbi:MAG: hypothetical protein ABJH06_19070 [Paraglaciecola sp.]|uniref:capsular polysaccharide export protein, LipB/KpsS family n=1 Tax=Paraglaciecola sp. TaxID=1920173 RepID=UPI00329A4366